jgi:hypothetical protein
MTLGRIGPDDAVVASCLAALADEMSPERLFWLLSRSKVTRLALNALAGQHGSAWAKELDRLLAAEVHADDEWQAKALPKMREVVEAAAGLDGRIIKGLCVQSLYPLPGLRHLGDVDVQYPHWPGAIRMVGWLRERGWVYDTAEYPWLKWHEGGPLYGQLSLVYPDNAQPYARVDLHIGAFSVGHSGLLPLTGWRAGSALGAPATVPGVEDSIAITAAHALCDQMLSIKDLNDLYALVMDTTPDWVSVFECCRAAGAGGALGTLLDAARAVYPQDADAFGRPTGRLTRLDLHPPDARRRAGAFAGLAYRDERSRGAGVLAAARTARAARRYFAAELTPRTAVRGDGAPGSDRRGRGRCWRLVPSEIWASLPSAAAGGSGRVRYGEPAREELGAGLSLLTVADAAVIVCGADVFIPTIWGKIAPASVALAADIAERLT